MSQEQQLEVKKKKKKQINVNTLLEGIEKTEAPPDEPKEKWLDLPPELKQAYEEHKKKLLEPREEEPSFWNSSEETVLALKQMRVMAEDNDHRWSTIRVSQMKTKDAKNMDRNLEVMPVKEIVVEE